MVDISIWLIPQQEQEAHLQQIVTRLAKEYGSFPFIPHITAYYLGSSFDITEVLPIVEKAAQQTKSFTIRLEKVDYSDVFTKTLFAKYNISPQFSSLYNFLRDKFYDRFAYELNPHLSLLYRRNLSQEVKKEEAKHISVPNQLILDRLAVITKPGGVIEKEEDVKDWQASYEFPLQNRYLKPAFFA